MGWLKNLFTREKSVDTDAIRPPGNFISPEVPRQITVTKSEDPNNKSIIFDIQDLRIPNNQILIQNFKHELKSGDRAMLTGSSGSGKSTLFRAVVSSLWPYGVGNIQLPASYTVMVLPQKPHLPLVNLQGVLAYPREQAPYTREEMEEMLDVVGLEWLKELLDNPDVHGDVLENTLSGGEKQRLAFARLFLAKPEIVFLDECTSALDVDWQDKMYNELVKRMPDSIIVSISHRAELKKYHKTSLALGKDKLIVVSPIEQMDETFLGSDTVDREVPETPKSPKPPKP